MRLSKDTVNGIILEIILILILIGVLCLFQSCKPAKEIVYIETARTDTLYNIRARTDSIYIRDSVFVKEWTKGDTVFQVQYKFRDRWRDQIIRDSIYIHEVDSIPYPVTIEKIKYVEKSLTWWQKLKMSLGMVFLGIIGISGGLFAFAYWRK